MQYFKWTPFSLPKANLFSLNKFFPNKLNQYKA